MKSARLMVGLALTAVVTVGLAAIPAHADFFQNSSGLASPAQTITFDEVVLPPGTSVTNQYAALGVTFSPHLYYDNQVDPFPNIAGHRVGNFFPVVDPFSILFASPQTEAAFAMVTNPGNSTFTALLGGLPVQTATAFTTYTSADDYFGFKNITFDQIQVSPGSELMLLDNLQTGAPLHPAATPEPGTLALLATGALPLLRRRRRPLAAV